jgi:hypothetical protein
MLDPFVAYIGKTCGQGLLGCRQLGRIGAGLVRVPTNPVLHVGSIITIIKMHSIATSLPVGISM